MSLNSPFSPSSTHEAALNSLKEVVTFRTRLVGIERWLCEDLCYIAGGQRQGTADSFSQPAPRALAAFQLRMWLEPVPKGLGHCLKGHIIMCGPMPLL